MYEAKTKVLISCAVITQLNCAYVSAYMKSWVFLGHGSYHKKSRLAALLEYSCLVKSLVKY